MKGAEDSAPFISEPTFHDELTTQVLTDAKTDRRCRGRRWESLRNPPPTLPGRSGELLFSDFWEGQPLRPTHCYLCRPWLCTGPHATRATFARTTHRQRSAGGLLTANGGVDLAVNDCGCCVLLSDHGLFSLRLYLEYPAGGTFLVTPLCCQRRRLRLGLWILAVWPLRGLLLARAFALQHS
jgi:hypothetical protein